MLDDNVPTSSQWRSATTTTAVPARSRPTHHEEASLSWWLSVIACKINAIKKYMQVIYRIFQAYIKLLFPRQRSNSENCDVHSANGREVCMLRIMRTAYNCTPTANSKRAAFYLRKSPARGLQHIRYSHSLRARGAWAYSPSVTPFSCKFSRLLRKYTRLDSQVLFCLLLQISSHLLASARQTRIFIGYSFQIQEARYLPVRKWQNRARGMLRAEHTPLNINIEHCVGCLIGCSVNPH